MKARHLVILAGAALAAALAPMGDAQAQYPADKAIRLVSPYGAGGAVDIAGRILSSVSGEFLNTRVDVVSMAGAGGQEAIRFVQKAEADGYTLLMTDYGPLVTTALREKVDYALSDWVPVVQVTEVVPTFFAKAGGPYATVEAWMKAAKDKPNTISIGHGRHLSVPHLPLILLEQKAGIKNNHIPTTGGGEALAFVLGGQTDIGASVPSTIQSGVNAGTLVALAVASSERVASLPKTPTLRELGYDVVLPAWYTIFAHKSVPQERLKLLEEKIIAALKSPSAVELGKRTGTVLDPKGMAASKVAYDTTVENLKVILKDVPK